MSHRRKLTQTIDTFTRPNELAYEHINGALQISSPYEKSDLVFRGFVSGDDSFVNPDLSLEPSSVYMICVCEDDLR